MSRVGKLSYLICIIHNQEERIPAKTSAEKLQALLPDSSIQEIYEQDEFVTELPKLELFTYVRDQYNLERLWRRHLLRPSKLRDLVAAFNRNRTLALIALRRDKRLSVSRIRQIEKALTLKHQGAWEYFLSTSAQSLIVMESDAIWIQDFSARVASHLNVLDSPSPSFIDFAGGTKEWKLGAKKIQRKDQDDDRQGLTQYSRALTNTTCCYAINRPLAELLCDFVSDNPNSRFVASDWLLNSVFARLQVSGSSVVCYHARPHLISHGSAHGQTTSWHPER